MTRLQYKGETEGTGSEESESVYAGELTLILG